MKEIDHIGVLVDNLEEAEAFLADVLELDPGKKLNTPEEGFRAFFWLRLSCIIWLLKGDCGM